MINYVDISSFMQWFINTIVNIIGTVLDILDNIHIANNVSILDFIIALIVIGAFVSIVITIPAKVKINEQKERSKNDRNKRRN